MAPSTVTAAIAVVDQTRILDALTRIEHRLDAIEQAISRVHGEQLTHDLTEETLMSDLNAVVTDLETRVSDMTDVEESASTLLAELGAKVGELTTDLQNAGVDPAIVQRLTDLGHVISDEDGKLAQAVAANTPADTSDTDTSAPAPADSGDITAPTSDTVTPNPTDADGNPI